MIVIFYYYPSAREEEGPGERIPRGLADRRRLRGTHGRRFGITEKEGGEREKKRIVDDKERGRGERERGMDQEVICEEIVAACRGSDCSRF